MSFPLGIEICIFNFIFPHLLLAFIRYPLQRKFFPNLPDHDTCFRFLWGVLNTIFVVRLFYYFIKRDFLQIIPTL